MFVLSQGICIQIINYTTPPAGTPPKIQEGMDLHHSPPFGLLFTVIIV